MNGEREVNIGCVRQKGGFPQEEDGLGGTEEWGSTFWLSSRLGVRLAEDT